MEVSAENFLIAACYGGDADRVLKILTNCPDVDVNCKNERGRPGLTGLFIACNLGHTEIVKILLQHPRIDLAKTSNYGQSLFYAVSERHERLEIVDLLLNDSRVDLNSHWDSFTPLTTCLMYSQLNTIKRVIASGRYIVPCSFASHDVYGGTHALHKESLQLMEKFRADPHQTRYEVRRELGGLGSLAAELFAKVVFLCDDFLVRKPYSRYSPKTTENTMKRFFSIAEQLPMELQIILCHRTVRSMGHHISSKAVDIAFVNLVRQFEK
jgi:hypothetical protein